MAHHPYPAASYPHNPAQMPAAYGQGTGHTGGESWDMRSDTAAHGGSSYGDHPALPNTEPRPGRVGGQNDQALAHYLQTLQADDGSSHKERKTKNHVKEYRRASKRRENYAQDGRREGRRHKQKIRDVIDDARVFVGDRHATIQQQASYPQQLPHDLLQQQAYRPQPLPQELLQQQSSLPGAWLPASERR